MSLTPQTLASPQAEAGERALPDPQPPDPILALTQAHEEAKFAAPTLRLLHEASALHRDPQLRRAPSEHTAAPRQRLEGLRPAGARLIAVEGLDGSGGTTQIRLLAESLRAAGREVLTTAEPTRGPIGRLIRAGLADPDLLSEGVLPLLFAADRREHLEKEILPALARGVVVLTDRYLASSLAYQSLAAPMDEVYALNARFPAADLTLMLELPVDQCLARIEARGATRDRFETQEKLLAIEANYTQGLQLLASAGHRIAHISAAGSPQEVLSRCMNEVTPCLALKTWAGRRTPRSGTGSAPWPKPAPRT